MKYPVILTSFAATDWAAAFCKQFPSVREEDALGWFANALMRGFDEGVALSKQYVSPCTVDLPPGDVVSANVRVGEVKMRSHDRLVDLTLYLHAETERAVRVSDDGDLAMSVWLPKSQCQGRPHEAAGRRHRDDARVARDRKGPSLMMTHHYTGRYKNIGRCWFFEYRDASNQPATIVVEASDKEDADRQRLVWERIQFIDRGLCNPSVEIPAHK